jgi:hypothetical protein
MDAMNNELHGISNVVREFSRRDMLATSAAFGGLTLPSLLRLQSSAASPSPENRRHAKACIIVYAWGGMSHHETWDPKLNAPVEFRGEFNPIATATSGIQIGEHLPYPLVDNGTLQAGEYGGWLGAKHDPIVIRTPSGTPFGGVSRSLGSQVLNLGDVDFERVAARNRLRSSLEKPISTQNDFDSFVK